MPEGWGLYLSGDAGKWFLGTSDAFYCTQVGVPGCTAPGQDAVAKAVTATNQIPQALEKPLSENGPLAAVFPDGAPTTIQEG